MVRHNSQAAYVGLIESDVASYDCQLFKFGALDD